MVNSHVKAKERQAPMSWQSTSLSEKCWDNQTRLAVITVSSLCGCDKVIFFSAVALWMCISVDLVEGLKVHDVWLNPLTSMMHLNVPLSVSLEETAFCFYPPKPYARSPFWITAGQFGVAFFFICSKYRVFKSLLSSVLKIQCIQKIFRTLHFFTFYVAALCWKHVYCFFFHHQSTL